jgi:glutamine amidotransferase
MIAIIDHGQADAGPLERAFREIGARAEIVHSIEQLQRCSKLVVAGAAPLAALVRSLRDRGLVGPLVRAILDGRPFLGIGPGLHLLLDVSYENGQHTGLGLIAGKAVPFESDSQHPVRRQFRPPHVGWTPVTWTARCPLFNGLESGASFYFDHVSRAQPLDREIAVASARFGVEFAATLWDGRTFGVQFIPEKSQESGRVVLSNFAAL